MVILLAMYSEGNIWLWYHSVSKTFFSCFTSTCFWHGSDLDHVTQLFWTISSQLYVNSTCNIKLKLFNITWFDLAQYVQRCPRMFRCWQQITHPFSFSEAIKEKYSHTDRCWARNMQWIFRDFQELNPAVYYFCLFIFFKNTIKNLKLHLVKYYQKSNSKHMFQLWELQ